MTDKRPRHRHDHVLATSPPTGPKDHSENQQALDELADLVRAGRGLEVLRASHDRTPAEALAVLRFQ